MVDALQLTVIYDGDCILCRRSVHWLERQQTHVEISSVAASRPEAVAEHGEIPGYGDNMVVVASDGRVWVGPPDAYLVVMWAVRGTRILSYLLAAPGLKLLAGRAFQFVAGNRHLVGRMAGGECTHCVA